MISVLMSHPAGQQMLLANRVTLRQADGRGASSVLSHDATITDF
jgi:hypothetical protein